MTKTRASRAQGVLVWVAIALVASFFVFGMVGPMGASQPAPGSTPGAGTPSVQTPQPVADSQPGVPTVPVAEHETWPDEEGLNPDRQLDVAAPDPLVGLLEAPSEDLAGYWSQEVDWQPCDAELCATVLAPLDWEDPGRAAIELVMRKAPSAEPTGESIFVNPGGPGVGGQSLAARVGTERWPGYDIIGWDPRGTGESTHVECGALEEIDALRGQDTTPDDEDDRQELIDAWAEFARSCRASAGDLLDHITTIEVVRDMDLLRHLVGSEKLNFFGVSYGTYLGAMYAELFGDRTGRLLLDSAVNITDNEDVPTQAEGFELALTNYAEWCAEDDRCPFGDSAEAVLSTVDEFLDELDANPVSVGDRAVNARLGLTGILLFLYSDEEAYPALTYVITEAMQGRAETLLQAADDLDGRDDHFAAFPAMSCADWPDEGIDAAFDSWQEAAAEGGVVTRHMGVQLPCEVWTADSAPQLRLTAADAPELIVIGTTGDSATPYEHAVSMAEQLVGGVLVTYDGAGHGSVLGGDECLARIAAEFFADGTLPEPGTTCS